MLPASTTKLHGFAFWRSLGSPKKVVAPMVEYSELSFRSLCRLYGAELAYTPMLHSRIALEYTGYLEKFFTTNPADRPLFVQFCGNDPDIVLQAAKRVEKYCDAIDLNLGCPQNIAKRGHYGAYLLEDTNTCVSIVKCLHEQLTIPVTVKVRLLPTWEDTIRTILALQNAGASVITVHGRRKEETQERTSFCDWETIRRIKCHPDVHIPIIANGGIACTDDVDTCLQFTGVDAVMVSESLLENPGLFTNGYKVPRRFIGFSSSSSSTVTPTTPTLTTSTTIVPTITTMTATEGSSEQLLQPPLTSHRSDSLDYAFEYLDLAEMYDEGYQSVRGHIMRMLLAPFKLYPEIRNEFLRTNKIETARTVLQTLGKYLKHPRAIMATDPTFIEQIRTENMRIPVYGQKIYPENTPIPILGNEWNEPCVYLRPTRIPMMEKKENIELIAKKRAKYLQRMERKNAHKLALKAAKLEFAKTTMGIVSTKTVSTDITTNTNTVVVEDEKVQDEDEKEEILDNEDDEQNTIHELSNKRRKVDTELEAKVVTEGLQETVMEHTTNTITLTQEPSSTVDYTSLTRLEKTVLMTIESPTKVDISNYIGMPPTDIDLHEWKELRTKQPNIGLPHPAFLSDPLQPGLWYLRYQQKAFGGRASRGDGIDSFIKLQQHVPSQQLKQEEKQQTFSSMEEINKEEKQNTS